MVSVADRSICISDLIILLVQQLECSNKPMIAAWYLKH